MRCGKPVEPVVVSEYDETIKGYPNYEGDGTIHSEETVLGTVVHESCSGSILTGSYLADTRRISKTHNAIVCRGCHRSWVFPNTVKTYGDLRKHFSRFNDHAIPSTLERVGLPV